MPVPPKVELVRLHLLQDGQRQRRRAGIEIVDARRHELSRIGNSHFPISPSPRPSPQGRGSKTLFMEENEFPPLEGGGLGRGVRQMGGHPPAAARSANTLVQQFPDTGHQRPHRQRLQGRNYCLRRRGTRTGRRWWRMSPNSSRQANTASRFPWPAAAVRRRAASTRS